MVVPIIQVPVSMLLFFVLFFGISFLLNMLLRGTWIMAFLYPIVVLLIVDNIPFSKYFTESGWAFSTAFERLITLKTVDILILSSGLLGAIVSGIVIKMLRKNGYQMF